MPGVVGGVIIGSVTLFAAAPLIYKGVRKIYRLLRCGRWRRRGSPLARPPPWGNLGERQPLVPAI